MLRTLLASAALLACALPARAQTTYAPTRDTLRFRETTQLSMTLTMPQGEIPSHGRAALEGRRRAHAGRSARGWFDSLGDRGGGTAGRTEAGDRLGAQPSRCASGSMRAGA